MRLIDERFYLVLLCAIPEWRLRPRGLTPQMRHGLKYIAVRRLMTHYDIVITAYIPHFIELASALHEIYGKRVIAISTHRYNQHKKDAISLHELNDCTKRLAQTPKAIKAVVDDYDYYYEQHYLGIIPQRLLVRPQYICSGSGAGSPQDNTILLIGREKKVFADFLNTYRDYCHTGTTDTRYSLKWLRDVHPCYRDVEELRRHTAFIVFPYSAYAFTHFELYALNIPIFIPSIRFVIANNIMTDRALPPQWCKEHLYKKMCDDIDAPDSPNSYHPQALRLWIGRSFLYRRKNCIIFDNVKDLILKLKKLEQNRKTITRGMSEENQQLDEEALKAWCEALRALQLPLPKTAHNLILSSPPKKSPQ